MSYYDGYNETQGNAGPTGIPDPQNPGYDTAGYPLNQTGAPPVPRTGPPVATQGANPPGASAQPGAGQPTVPPPPPPPAVAKPGGGILAPFSEPGPQFPSEPRFDYPSFKAPSIDEALNDPGYQFRVQQGTQALQNAAAARGTLNDSGTLQNLISYGQNAAEQGYGNVYARAYGTWQGNEQNAQNIYGINRQTQTLDPWTAAYNAWVQRGNFYLNNQGTAANTALGFAQL